MELRPSFDLEVLLSQTDMAKSSYYYHEKRSESADKYASVKELISKYTTIIKGGMATVVSL